MSNAHSLAAALQDKHRFVRTQKSRAIRHGNSLMGREKLASKPFLNSPPKLVANYLLLRTRPLTGGQKNDKKDRLTSRQSVLFQGEKMRRKSLLLRKLYVLPFLVSLVTAVVSLVALFRYDRDIDSYINRAQVAADGEDMAEYLAIVKSNLEKHDATSGNTALIWKTSDTDLSMNYKAVTRLLGRLESIKDLPKNETTYQVALDDIRGTVREIPNPAESLVWRKYRLFILATAFAWFAAYGWFFWGPAFRRWRWRRREQS